MVLTSNSLAKLRRHQESISFDPVSAFVAEQIGLQGRLKPPPEGDDKFLDNWDSGRANHVFAVIFLINISDPPPKQPDRQPLVENPIAIKHRSRNKPQLAQQAEPETERLEFAVFGTREKRAASPAHVGHRGGTFEKRARYKMKEDPLERRGRTENVQKNQPKKKTAENPWQKSKKRQNLMEGFAANENLRATTASRITVWCYFI